MEENKHIPYLTTSKNAVLYVGAELTKQERNRARCNRFGTAVLQTEPDRWRANDLSFVVQEQESAFRKH
ncbi:hypothetical protein Y032_0105g3676 [Ancylostoma ceylanicum]|uniref:Uncharacterized protein n=1 Tax=Ancylostoma ceylanicum TaxID=53326 RepID=A0A016TGE7_9BILA|nr:hypothetical protein Y032_0105g3676 [Ancylostoma ceylanicum]